MINLYEKLGLSSESKEAEIRSRLVLLLNQHNINENQFNQITNILLTPENKTAYDRKLLHFLMSNPVQILNNQPSEVKVLVSGKARPTSQKKSSHINVDANNDNALKNKITLKKSNVSNTVVENPRFENGQSDMDVSAKNDKPLKKRITLKKSTDANAAVENHRSENGQSDIDASVKNDKPLKKKINFKKNTVSNAAVENCNPSYGKSRPSDSASRNNVKQKMMSVVDNLDNEYGIHDYYIWAVFIVIILSSILSLFISAETDMQVTFLVAIGNFVLLSLDWRMLDKNGKSIFTRWWFLLIPVYLFKRAKALGTNQKNLFIWIGIFVTSIGLMFISSNELEESSCDVVTDIIKNQLYRSTHCTNVTITDSNGRIHYGLAELSNGRAIDIQITETNNGNIWVEILD